DGLRGQTVARPVPRATTAHADRGATGVGLCPPEQPKARIDRIRGRSVLVGTLVRRICGWSAAAARRCAGARRHNLAPRHWLAPSRPDSPRGGPLHGVGRRVAIAGTDVLAEIAALGAIDVLVHRRVAEPAQADGLVLVVLDVVVLVVRVDGVDLA